MIFCASCSKPAPSCQLAPVQADCIPSGRRAESSATTASLRRAWLSCVRNEENSEKCAFTGLQRAKLVRICSFHDAGDVAGSLRERRHAPSQSPSEAGPCSDPFRDPFFCREYCWMRERKSESWIIRRDCTKWHSILGIRRFALARFSRRRLARGCSATRHGRLRSFTPLSNAAQPAG